jgi:hypothetical protein
MATRAIKLINLLARGCLSLGMHYRLLATRLHTQQGCGHENKKRSYANWKTDFFNAHNGILIPFLIARLLLNQIAKTKFLLNFLF